MFEAKKFGCTTIQLRTIQIQTIQILKKKIETATNKKSNVYLSFIKITYIGHINIY